METINAVLKEVLKEEFELGEFYKNVRNCFDKLKLCLEDATKRRRIDLVVKYTDLLSQVVSHLEENKKQIKL